MIRRLTSGIVASFETLVGQIENHEAQVTAAIREAELAAARASVQLARVKKDGLAMRRSIEDQRQKVTVWEERARACAAQDEAKALQCVKMRQQGLERIKVLEEQALTHDRLEKQLSADLDVVREKLSQLKSQRNLMRVRQSRADAMAHISCSDSRTIGEIDDIFERWEARIGACELQAEVLSAGEIDDLDAEFRSSEETRELKAVLESLTKQA